jgi:hypothetical protein
MAMSYIDRIRQIVAEHQAAKVIWTDPSTGKNHKVLIDAFSAQTVIAVYDAVNETNRAKLRAMPLPRMVSVCFQMLSKAKTA